MSTLVQKLRSSEGLCAHCTFCPSCQFQVLCHPSSRSEGLFPHLLSLCPLADSIFPRVALSIRFAHMSLVSPADHCHGLLWLAWPPGRSPPSLLPPRSREILDKCELHLALTLQAALEARSLRWTCGRGGFLLRTPPFLGDSSNPKHSLVCGHFIPLSAPMFTQSSPLCPCGSFSSSLSYVDAGLWV